MKKATAFLGASVDMIFRLRVPLFGMRANYAPSVVLALSYHVMRYTHTRSMYLYSHGRFYSWKASNPIAITKGR